MFRNCPINFVLLSGNENIYFLKMAKECTSQGPRPYPTLPILPSSLIHTANEGPMRIQYKCLVPIYVFPEMKLLFPKQNYNIPSPSSYTLIYLCKIYIFPGLVCLFCCREICGPILGIYKLLMDT
jgi:hypothetical protein